METFQDLLAKPISIVATIKIEAFVFWNEDRKSGRIITGYYASPLDKIRQKLIKKRRKVLKECVVVLLQDSASEHSVHHNGETG